MFLMYITVEIQLLLILCGGMMMELYSMFFLYKTTSKQKATKTTLAYTIHMAVQC